MRLASVSIDLDELHHYYAIHGLSEPARGEHGVYDTALTRAAAWARSLDLPLTLFAIGRDLARPESAQALAQLARAGHEIGNHSLSHRYDLTLRSRAEIEHEVAGGSAAIRAATGLSPSGFRAPGYLMTDELADVLVAQGYAYDSSVFPSPAYYAAKAAKLLSLRLRSRASRSVRGSASVLLSPSRPYRLGRPYWRAGAGLLELPVQVTPVTRLPYIGTSIVLLGVDAARILTRTLAGEPFVNLELHGIDFLGADDGLEPLFEHQPDAKLTLSRKLAALSGVIELLKQLGYGFVRLDEAARAIA
jgi:peptidoglycan/xylan/chitin deacetylase (PgdA/CDA1 family)